MFHLLPQVSPNNVCKVLVAMCCHPMSSAQQYWGPWASGASPFIGILPSKAWAFPSVWSLKCWILKIEIFQGKTDLTQQQCRESSVKSGRHLKGNGEKNIFLQCWCSWTLFEPEGYTVVVDWLLFPEKMVLKHTDKCIGCWQIKFASFFNYH